MSIKTQNQTKKSVLTLENHVNQTCNLAESLKSQVDQHRITFDIFSSWRYRLWIKRVKAIVGTDFGNSGG